MKALKPESHPDLILALEIVRTRFIVAVALEQKSTSRQLWRIYLETEHRLRRCLKTLRAAGSSCGQGSRQQALALDAIAAHSGAVDCRPGKGDARSLYRLLEEVLPHLEAMRRD